MPKVEARELAKRTWNGYKESTDLMISHFGRGRLAADLRPDDFERLKKAMAKKRGPIRLRNVIQNIRSSFKFGLESQLLTMPVRFAPGFARPSKKTLRLERAWKGPRMFETEEISRLVDGPIVVGHAGPK